MCIRTSQSNRKRQAFTLAELLIVIAIIGVLIAILLPALSAARRSAATVKCLSSLRNLGSAFQQYAQDNKRFLPVTLWRPVSAAPTWSVSENPNNQTERTWIDMLSKYVLKQSTNGDPTLYAKYQNNSVFWGCPSFDVSLFDPAPAIANLKHYSLGYGMSIYSIGPYQNTNAPNGTIFSGGSRSTPFVNAAVMAPGLTPSAFYAGSATVSGNFYKLEQWGRHSQDKGILADANGYDIVCSTNWNKSSERTTVDKTTPPFVQPEVFGMVYPAAAAPGSEYISVDASRHIAPTADKKKALNGNGVNMLFVDGHAQSITPRQAWIATFGGGTDSTGP